MGGGWVELQDIRDCGAEVLVTMLWRLPAAVGEVRLGQVFHLVRASERTISRIRVFLSEQEAIGAAE